MDQPKTWQFPDKVILNICTAYQREKDQIREPWPWFQTVLIQEYKTWNAQQHEQESRIADKRTPIAHSIKEILEHAKL
jgi:allantoicase